MPQNTTPLTIPTTPLPVCLLLVHLGTQDVYIGKREVCHCVAWIYDHRANSSAISKNTSNMKQNLRIIKSQKHINFIAIAKVLPSICSFLSHLFSAHAACSCYCSQTKLSRSHRSSPSPLFPLSSPLFPVFSFFILSSPIRILAGWNSSGLLIQ